MTVSIHAPWEGCDSWSLSVSVSYLEFQFTHPGKGATEVLSYRFEIFVICFNSRTLGRVRQLKVNWREQGVSVSIHAPWEGCDVSTFFWLYAIPLFQFTHPGKGATGHKGRGCKPVQFQFTHPGQGATNVKSL